MCAIDLSNLKLVEEVIETTDESQYKDATEFPPPFDEGLYTFIQGKPELEASNEGKNITANMTQTVVGGQYDGQKIAFDRVSDKQFERSGVKVSMMMDHIRAVYGVGTVERSARTRQERADAMVAGEGKTFQAKTVWDGYCGHKDTEFDTKAGGINAKPATTIKGQRNFPNGNDVPCPVCGQSIRPRNKINIRVAAQ